MKKSFIFLLSFFVVIGLLIGFNGLARDVEEDDTSDIDPGEVIISPEDDQPEDVIEEEIEEVTVDEDITAEDLGISEPKLLPDNPFYFVKNFWRGVRTTFTFNKVKKAELRLRYANERLIEAKKLAEKTGKEEVFQKTLQKYQNDIEKIEVRVEKFKEKAKDNPKIDKFLDKFTEKTVKHQILMDRLEKNLSDKPEVLERIRDTKEKTLEHFGEVMERLEEKDKIPERLEKNMEKIEGSKYKNFKNLEVLMKLEDKVPEQAKEAIQQAQENALKRLHGNLEEMSSGDQERFGEYLEGVSGDQTIHLEIVERLKERKLTPILKEKLENNRGEIQIRVENLRERIYEQREEQKETGEETPEKIACPMVWAPVCGKDERTYGNACLAKVAGVEIAYKGKCKVERFCKDLCGDGICQEIVCLAEGCPCAETPRTCPQDCSADVKIRSEIKPQIGPDAEIKTELGR